MNRWHEPTPLDIIAALSIIVCGIAMFKGVEGDFVSPVLLIIGYYFGKRSSGNPYDTNPKT